MSGAALKPQLIRLAIFTVTGATALSVAACSTSHNQNSGQPSTSASPTSVVPKPPAPPVPPTPPVGKDHIEGLVRSVSGNTIHLTQRDRTSATVDFRPTTMVTELGSAQLSDVTPGSCVDVKAVPGSAPPGGAITAQSIEISPALGGKCPPPAGQPSSQPAAFGTVASVTGNAFTVTGTDPTGKSTHTNVTVSSTTTYIKHAPTNAQAIQNGKCMAAQGTISGGVLQAATIDLEPCPPMGGGHHRFHLPHLPHLRHH
jgi:Domain of unknown function (DUF5666)